LANAHYYLGLVHHLQGDNQTAILDYDRATQLGPQLLQQLDEEAADNYILAVRRALGNISTGQR